MLGWTRRSWQEDLSSATSSRSDGSLESLEDAFMQLVACYFFCLPVGLISSEADESVLPDFVKMIHDFFIAM